MTRCDYCGKNIDGYPHKCKYCGRVHCSNHLLPEAHNCVGLEEHRKRKIEKWQSPPTTFSSVQRYEEPLEEEEIITKRTHRKNDKKQSLKDKTKNYFLTLYEDFIYWLRKREHYKYDYGRRANYIITTILLFAASLIGFSIFYSNAQKLNEIDLWIIKLSGVLILASLFFAIKYGWRLGKELINILKRQRNWLKYLIIILVIFLLWQSYVNKDTVLNPMFDVYNQTNFSLFAPVSFGNFSLDFEDKDSDEIGFVEDIFFDAPERKEECQDTFDRLNEIRTSYGKSQISWDDRAYKLAVARSKDMYERDYMDHTSPTGECPENMKRDYGFSSNEYLAENAGGMSYYSKGSVAGDCDEALDSWLTSRGHRYNLLYDIHKSGAIGCFYEICVFLGVHNDFYGLGEGGECYYASEGEAYWNTAGAQPGEV